MADEGTRRRRRAALALCFYAVATLVIAAPLPFYAGETIPRATRPDTWLNLWALSWTAEHLLTSPSALFDANIFFPRSNTLAYTDHFIGQALLVAPVYWVSGGVLAYNLAWYLAFTLTAWGGYLWVRRALGDVPGGEAAAFVAGAICLLVPGKRTALSHLQVISLQGVTLALFAFHGVLQRPGLYSGLGLAAAAAWAALCSWYTAAYVGLLLPVLGLIAIGVPGLVTDRARVAGFGVAALILAAVVVAPVAGPYQSVQEELAVQRPVEELAETSLRPVDYVASWSWLHAPWLPSGSGAGGYFLGFVASALALIGVVVAARDGERWPLAYAAVGAGFMVLSLGPRLQVGDATIPLPYGLLYEHVPGFTGLRNPYRAAFIAALLFALPAGRGALWVIGRCRLRLLARDRWRTRPRVHFLEPASWGAAAILVLIHLLEAWPGPQEVARLPRPGPAWAWLAERGEEGALFAWPLPRPIDYNARYQLWTIASWQPLVNGHSGIFPPEFVALYSLDAEFPEPRYLATIKEWFPVRRIVADYGEVADGARRRNAAHEATGLRAVWEGGDVVVYALDNGEAAGWLRRRLPRRAVTEHVEVSLSPDASGCALKILVDGRVVAEVDAGSESQPGPQGERELHAAATLDVSDLPDFVWLELMLADPASAIPPALEAGAGAGGQGRAHISINGWPLVEGAVAAALIDGSTGRPKLWDRATAEGTSAAVLLRRLLGEAAAGDWLAFAAIEGNDPQLIERSRLLLDAAGGPIVSGPLDDVARTIAFTGVVGSAPGRARVALGDAGVSLAADPPGPACRSASIRRFSFR